MIDFVAHYIAKRALANMRKELDSARETNRKLRAEVEAQRRLVEQLKTAHGVRGKGNG